MRRLVSIGISVALLALLYAHVDVGTLVQAARSADPRWLSLGLSLVIPLTIATAYRFKLLTTSASLSGGEALRLILAASTLNLFLPSKLGDLAKAYVLSAKHGLNAGLSFSIVVLEKALDMMSLILLGTIATFYLGWSQPLMAGLAVALAGFLVILLVILLPLHVLPSILDAAAKRLPDRFSPPLREFAHSWRDVIDWYWRNPYRAIGIIVLSVALWALHLLQFWFFTLALNKAVPLLDNMAFATLSILVGLLPFTLAGIGSRDAAIVFFYGPYLTPGAGAALGILATLRYVLPAVAGVPFAGEFAAAAATLRRRKAERPS